ncbi:transporter substrate-binding domain-containing protein [Pseudoalteromonas sp. P94(2023)]|uniref:Transporter substrate-binding domain-containing protein n=2 Tax=Pseudoalteromonas obscura TaxID=3048491 RepID=A0ABT7EKA2_9GAMM|nr:transporter substrate-binding domain-containing protein [Pseudoalteromonas sp. P94(2023)]
MIKATSKLYRELMLNVCTLTLMLVAVTLSRAAYSCEKSLRVSISGNWPPYSQRVNGQYEGLEVEVVELVLKEAGFCWQYVELPSSSRAFKQFQENKVDLIPAASFTQSRRKYAEFSLPYRQEVMLLFAHQDNTDTVMQESSITSTALLRHLKNNLIAINRGSVYGQGFEGFRKVCEDCVVETNFAHERFNLIKHKRVEYAVEDILTGAHLTQETSYKGVIRATAIKIYDNPIHYMLRPGMLSEPQLRQLNLAIIKNRQRIEEIVQRYKQRYGAD